MIEKTQKQIIFEEAAKKGIVGSQLMQVPEILKSILGVSDVGKQVYGAPLAPLYRAKIGEKIEVSRISDYFVGVNRDLKVADLAMTELEDNLLMLNYEMWTRMELLKNKSTELSKKARVEKLRSSLGATWVYTETFTNTQYLDMENTSAWIDTSEGVAYLPNSGDEQTVPMQEISIESFVLDNQCDYLGSNPKHAFDGLDNTNWRCLFVNSSWTSAVATLAKASDITAITIDPVGFGIELTVDIDAGNGFEQKIKSIVYSKETFPLDVKQVKKVQIAFKSATSVLPKTVGIREIVMYKSQASKSATVYTKLLKPTDPFTEIKINTSGKFPVGTEVSTYFRTATGNAWTKVEVGDWHPIYATDTAALYVDATQAVAGTSSLGFRGLYAVSIPISKIPLSISEGEMNIGENMVEVSTFKKDWAEDGDIPHVLSQEDFSTQRLARTWSNVSTKFISSAGTGIILQYNGQTSINGDSDLTRDGNLMMFQRRITGEYAENITTYNHLYIVPLVGNSSLNRMQYDYNYRIKYHIYCPKQFSFSGAKYWFYQGYRNAGRRAYKDIGKAYGTFSLYINGTLVAGDALPNTIYTDGTTDGGATGKDFSISMNAGWNVVELLMNVINPADYGTDSFDSANSPYLQLSFYPSLFDQEFKQDENHYVTSILASQTSKPVGEFDLLWNLPKDPTFWSWSGDRNYVYFNTNQLKYIDGYFRGSAPQSYISYRSVTNDTVDDLYLKVEIEREDTTTSSPILEDFNVMVR